MRRVITLWLALAALLALGCSGRCPERAVLTSPDPSRPTCAVPVDENDSPRPEAGVRPSVGHPA